MNIGSKLTIRAYHIYQLEFGNENRVTVDGRMTVNENSIKTLAENESMIKEVSLRIIKPDEHNQYTNTIMDVIPLSTKVLGKVGEGISHTLTGMYVLLTGVEEGGRQVCNFGASNGILSEKIAWGMAGTPDKTDLLLMVDIILKNGASQERTGVDAAHRVCDEFCQIFRTQMKKFNGYKCTEKHVFQETYEPERKNIVIVKEVSGQGAVYDTRMFGKEPASFIGGKSIIDMGCMPVIVTPNEYRDGIMRAMD